MSIEEYNKLAKAMRSYNRAKTWKSRARLKSTIKSLCSPIEFAFCFSSNSKHKLLVMREVFVKE